jgi:hypothetical protein
MIYILMFRNFKNSKNAKFVSKKPSTLSTVVKVNRYDVLFDLDHLKSLLYGQNFMNDVPLYLNKFFFRYGSDMVIL